MNKRQHFLVVFHLFTFLPFLSMAQTADGPTMGWSSWNTYRVRISDSLIMRQADAMVSKGLDKAGYRYVNIDDGYFGGRAADGQLLIHPTRFPRGLKPVVDHIHDLGLKAGIYSDAGRNTCGNYYDKDSIAQGVGLYGHDDRDADFFFRQMGFDFIKVDFCGGDGPQNKERLTLDERKRYTAISEAIKRTGRKDVRLNVCRWDFPGTWVSDAASSWRISHDISPRWSSVKGIIHQSLPLSAYCHDGHFNDMDMLEVGRGMSLEEDKTHFALWCIMSSPLLIGCNLETVSDETLALLTNEELIAINQDPLYLQAYVAQKQGDCYLLVKDIHELQGLQRAFAVYNPSDREQPVTVRFRDLDLGGSVNIRDLFEHRELGILRDSLLLTLPAHATRIFTATAEQRLQRQCYEAETAYISDYQEIRNNQAEGTGIYEDDDLCSGGMKATWLGGKSDNDLIWKHVYVNETGEYSLIFACLTDEPRSMNVSVNGCLVCSLSCSQDNELTVKTFLQKGSNEVRLWNADSRMPDIDYMQLCHPKKND